jgi:trafficking protein particle complex subunit 9
MSKSDFAQKLTDLVPTDSFSPLAFPDGRIVYNFSLSESPALSVECFPFELNREAQVVLFLADGSDVIDRDHQVRLQRKEDPDRSSSGSQDESQDAWMLNLLEDEVRASRPHYRRAILHQLLVFDAVVAADSPSVSADMLLVPSPEKSRGTTMKTVMCDITARLLHSMNDLAHEIHDLSIIESPSSAPSSNLKATEVAARANGRMSMPGRSTRNPPEREGSRKTGVTDDISRSTTPASGRSASRHSVASPNRSDRFSEVSSAFGSRDPSRDRNSMVSRTVTTPTERKKNRSIARSRIVIGAIYLQAGLWPDAVKDLSEGTAMARSNNDYVWHAKGLEYIIACLLMLGWAKMYFQVNQRRSKHTKCGYSRSIDTSHLLPSCRKAFCTQIIFSNP